jgi:hypothetical protein
MAYVHHRTTSTRWNHLDATHQPHRQTMKRLAGHPRCQLILQHGWARPHFALHLSSFLGRLWPCRSRSRDNLNHPQQRRSDQQTHQLVDGIHSIAIKLYGWRRNIHGRTPKVLLVGENKTADKAVKKGSARSISLIA